MRPVWGRPFWGLAVGALVLGAGLVTSDAARAQNQPAWQGQPPPTAPQQRPPAPAKQQTKRPAADGAASPATGSEAGLRQRVEQLEEQLVDLQVIVGTVESLARGGGASTASTAYRGGVPVSGGLAGPDAGRVAALETQVQALTQQLEQMTEQMRALQSGGQRGPSGPAPRGGASQSSGGFGTTTVVSPNDPIANIIKNQDPRSQGSPQGSPQGSAPGATPALAPRGNSAGRQQYETAYSQLLQQNYPAAEAGFVEFLQAYPNDELTPNAQFWLGETHFVRSQWDSAAAAFLKVAQNHPRSDKAPDSLAKFAMSMERKGNKPAACRALQELNTRYPTPPAHVKSWEVAERRRAGCG